MESKRFAQISKDPKFRRAPKSHNKIKIDRRFRSMFTDKKFQSNYNIDKRGRPVKHRSKDDLKGYYAVSSDEESESEEEKGSRLVEVSEKESITNSEDESEDDNKEKHVDSEDSKSDKQIEHKQNKGSTKGKDSKESVNKLKVKLKSDKKLPDNIKEKLRDLHVDYARGEQSLLSESSSDDEETDDEVSESEEIDHRWGEMDADAEPTEEATYRLAACNLDWDRIRASDLLVLFNSFLPPGGVIISVAIYPSEFGKQRIKEEEIKGPIELVESKKDVVQSEDETEEGSKYHMEKLRQYQLNRLKYYYAVITFDNANSANKIYTECDGMEYESSATKLDLRFIPDDMTFDDVPKESCDKLPEKYEPRFFTTTALQQAKVELTWDETNPDRLEFNERMNSGKIDDISERDLQNYLAGSSGEEESDEESNSDESQAGNSIDKYKALLQDIQTQEEEKSTKDKGLEISWGIDIKEKTDKLIKEKQRNLSEKTPFEKYLDKRKEKRKERRELKKKAEQSDDDSDMPSDIDMNDPYFAEEFANEEFKKPDKKKKNKVIKGENDAEPEDELKKAELDLLLMNGEEDGEKKHFNFKKIQDNEGNTKKKRKKKKKVEDKQADEDEFNVNVDDKRFSALFTSHNFNIDPTHPQFKKTKGMESFIKEKIKRREREDETLEVGTQQAKKPKKDKQKNVELTLAVKNVKRNLQMLKNQ